MSHNFILAQVSEHTFEDLAHEKDPGRAWLMFAKPHLYDWLAENEIEYSVQFEYTSPFATSDSVRVRLVVEDDQSAVLIRLKWS